MKFNPFANIYNKNGDLSSSLSDKIYDTFFVFWGDPSKPVPDLGLFDYFTFTLPLINLYVLAFMAGIIMIEPITALFFAPFVALSGIIFVIDKVLRFLTSSILTVLLMPIIILVHVISTELKRWNVKQEINNKIKECLDLGDNSVIIDIPTHRHEWIETIANHLIDKLNNNPIITRLEINYSNLKKDLLGELVLKLTYVTKFSAPHADFTKQIPLDLPKIYTKNKKEICETQDLLNFLTKNTHIDELNVFRVNLGWHFLNELNKMLSEGVQYPCKLLTQDMTPLIQQINSTMTNISEANSLLKSCFEFYKMASSMDEKGTSSIIKDVLQYIIMMSLKMCPENIVEKNQKGFIRAINSNGFFTQKTAQLTDFDPQEQSTKRITEI